MDITNNIMLNSFLDYFNRSPDFTQDSDFFFNTDFDKILSKFITAGKTSKTPWHSIEEYHQFMQQKTAESFQANWNIRTIITPDAETIFDFPWVCDNEVCTVLRMIGESGKPFLDIASSPDLGMASFIKKISPSAPCLISDFDMASMRFMSTFLKATLPDYPFFFTSFNNNNIPIHDNALDYVTSIDGMTSSSGTSRNSQKNGIMFCSGRETAISEVYRILKPGGYFVTTEQWWEGSYQWDSIAPSEKKISDVISSLREDSWESQFTKAGFHLILQRDYKKRFPTRDFFRQYNACCSEESHKVNLDMVDTKSIEINHATTFFVLQK